ncbi:MAG TPA: cupredoxin family copper-binding protein [Acetobacteraceae bacterium]|nr:cupredoxin family copper-binding protein [Acetobacteraceae bacterium]
MTTHPGGSRRALLLCAAGLVCIPVAGSAAEPAQAIVGIHNFAFQPAVLTVPRGTTVTWVNHDDSPHSIVLASLNVHSHPLDTDGRFSFRFEQPGAFAYRCGLHPHMQGTVVVQ